MHTPDAGHAALGQCLAEGVDRVKREGALAPEVDSTELVVVQAAQKSQDRQGVLTLLCKSEHLLG